MINLDLSSQLNIIAQHLRGLGYQEPDGAVIPNYEFTATKQRKGRTDLLAFANTQRYDISTACIAVIQWSKGEDKFHALKELSYVGAPIAMFAFPNYLEIWPVIRADSDEQPRIQEILSYNDLGQYLYRNINDLSPRAILNAKNGARQLSIFDIDPHLEIFARQATQNTLVEQFEVAIHSADSSVPQNVREENPGTLIRVAISVLAARILQDKLVEYPDFHTRDVISLLNAASQRFPNYFTNLEQDLSLVGELAVQTLYRNLSGEFTFRSLTNDMLAYFYENALVIPEVRKQLGIYYTSSHIAKRILHRLPVEDLRPENRTVLDGTCGSGNLLLATYDRLSALLPVDWTLEQRHDYLRKQIWGVDKDPFACQVARLSLLLYDLPIGDSWQIKQGDVLHVNPEHIFGSSPHIIVGNPPFNESRSSGGKRVEVAARVLNRYLDWLAPGGLLGVVVPITFLHKASVSDVRKKLLEQCDVLEVWHLPEGAIPGSSVVTAVILARKLPPNRTKSVDLLTRVERVDRSERRLFVKNSQPTVRYTTSQDRWSANPQRWMVSSPFDNVWDRIETQFSKLEPEFGIIRNGVQPGKKARESHFSVEFPENGWRKVLYENENRRTLEPFLINWDSQLIKYIKYFSKELQWPRNPEHFEVPNKLIMNATQNSENSWRFYAAIDRERLVVTENFHYVIPSSRTTVEELAAVFNSMLANAWYSSHNYQRDINLDSVRNMPFPRFNEHQKKEIYDRVRRIEELKRSAINTNIDAIHQNIMALDDVVFDAYIISREERTQIQSWMRRFRQPGQVWESTERLELPLKAQGPQWRFPGTTEAVDAKRGVISIWTQDLDDAVEIPIPQTMPGWALRPGATFLAAIPWEQRQERDLSKVTWLDFWPLDFGYLSDQELASVATKRGVEWVYE